MIFLGFGKYARADKIYALEPIETGDRGSGRADARVGREASPSRSSPRAPSGRSSPRWARTHGASSAILDDALALAERLAEAADQGKVDLGDLGRRAHRLLEKTVEAHRRREALLASGRSERLRPRIRSASRRRCRRPTVPAGSELLRLVAIDTRARCASRATTGCLWCGQAISASGTWRRSSPSRTSSTR